MTDNAAPAQTERPVLTNDEDMAARYLEITGQADEPADETPANESGEPAETQDAPAGPQEAEKPEGEAEEGAEADGEFDQEDAEAEPEGEGEESEVFEIPIGGVTEEVTLEQLAETWVKAKTGETEVSEALSQEREALTQERNQAHQAAQNYLQSLQQVGAFLEQSLPPEPDASLIQEDPLTYQQQQIVRQNAEKALSAIYQQFQATQAESQQRQAAAWQEAQMAAFEELPKLVPEWKDESVRDAGLKETTDYLLGQGFTDLELAQVTDPRSSVIAWKAMQWDKLQEQKPIAKKKTREAPKAVRKGERPAKRSADKKVQEAKQVLRKTGSDEAAEAFLLAKWNQGAR